MGLVPSLARPVLLAANSLAEKLTNVACEIVPDTIERGTVRTPEFVLRQVCYVSGVMKLPHHAGGGCRQGRAGASSCKHSKKPFRGETVAQLKLICIV